MAIKINSNTVIDDNMKHIGCGKGLCDVPYPSNLPCACKYCDLAPSLDLNQYNLYQIRATSTVNISCICNISCCNRIIVDFMSNNDSTCLLLPSCFKYTCTGSNSKKTYYTFENIGSEWIGQYTQGNAFPGDSRWPNYGKTTSILSNINIGAGCCVYNQFCDRFNYSCIDTGVVGCSSPPCYLDGNFTVICYGASMYGIGISCCNNGTATIDALRVWKIDGNTLTCIAGVTTDFGGFGACALQYFPSIISFSTELNFIIIAKATNATNSYGSSCVIVYSLTDLLTGTLTPLQYICSCGDNTSGYNDRSAFLYYKAATIGFHNMDTSPYPAKLSWCLSCNITLPGGVAATATTYVRKFWKGTPPCYVCYSNQCSIGSNLNVSNSTDLGYWSRNGETNFRFNNQKTICTCWNYYSPVIRADCQYQSCTLFCHVARALPAAMQNPCVGISTLCRGCIAIKFDCCMCHIAYLPANYNNPGCCHYNMIATLVSNTYTLSYCNPGFGNVALYAAPYCSRNFGEISLDDCCLYGAYWICSCTGIAVGASYNPTTCCWTFGGCCSECPLSGWNIYCSDVVRNFINFRDDNGSVLDPLGGNHPLTTKKLYSC